MRSASTGGRATRAQQRPSGPPPPPTQKWALIWWGRSAAWVAASGKVPVDRPIYYFWRIGPLELRRYVRPEEIAHYRSHGDELLLPPPRERAER